MTTSSNHRAYKVISLLLKAAILISSFCYIAYKLAGPSGSGLLQGLKSGNPVLLFITFILMFLNWGLEALKWKILIGPLEKISFWMAFRSIFAGVTVSIFMPNRVGEFAGRIFFLEKADKVEATLKNFAGSFAQFFMTFCTGIIAMFAVTKHSQSYADDHFSVAMIVQLVCVLVGSGLITFYLLNRLRKRFSSKIQSYFKAIADISLPDLFTVFILSFIRYCVFLFQYYLVIKAFGVRIDFEEASVLIAITFIITSAIPSFALTEVVTRGAVAASLFEFYSVDTQPVITASLVVWIINLAIPALTGSAFIWKLKFFKT